MYNKLQNETSSIVSRPANLVPHYTPIVPLYPKTTVVAELGCDAALAKNLVALGDPCPLICPCLGRQMGCESRHLR
ncbi:hypothetical protein BS47DRAFT_1483376 [Hydnum rufescens UP504]|uniref:Uncharacterized protein n=1 Tax=Hydnum rufescens UP504 TaxID=1448309 RepID=A0A9P6DWF8_9AGAM|nr:hypothetical protein BS47DRAFT_1483376 [Hydnum rufescens UP504]